MNFDMIFSSMAEFENCFEMLMGEEYAFCFEHIDWSKRTELFLVGKWTGLMGSPLIAVYIK